MPEKRVYRHSQIIALLIALLLPLSATANDADRWYTRQQVDVGQILYAQHCAQCHGPSAEGTTGWRRPGPDGRYTPPPLNGTGHAWHHPLPLLGRIIVHGSEDGNGNMPAWKDLLNDGEVNAILAWLQSQWPERVYTAWRDINARAANP